MLKNLSLIVFASLLSSCKIPTPNVPICVEISSGKAFCTYTISNKDFYWDDEHLFDKKTYWEARPTMIMVPPTSWAKIKAFILKMCKQSGDCTQEDVKSFLSIKEQNIRHKSPLACFGSECERN